MTSFFIAVQCELFKAFRVPSGNMNISLTATVLAVTGTVLAVACA